MRIFQWIAIAAMTLFFPISALAINLGATELGTAGTNAGIDTAGTEATLGGLVGSIVSTVLNIFGALLFLLFIYAGFLWMTAAGDPKQTQKAKDIMANSVAGLVIVMSAFSIVIFVMDELPGGMNVLGFELFDKTVTEAGFTAENALLLENIGIYINIILNILGVIILLIFLFAGFLWMTAAGDPKQVDKAKVMMRNAFVGLVIILLSRVIATFIVDSLVAAEVAHLPQAIHNTIGT